jgi:hypothetical protein
VQIDLVCQIGHLLPADVMAEQCDGDDQGQEPPPVALDRRSQLRAVGAVQAVRDETRQVHEDVGVAAAAGGPAENRSHPGEIVASEVGGGDLPPGAPQEPAEPAHTGLAPGHQEELVPLVEPGEGRPAPAGPRRPPEAVVGENPGDEALPEPRIVQPPLLLDRQLREKPEERLGEDPLPVSGRHGVVPLPRIELDPFHAAARRVLLEHIAGEIKLGELRHPPPGVLAHRGRMVGAGIGGDEPGLPADLHQADGRPRGAETDLDLRADRHPFDST